MWFTTKNTPVYHPNLKSMSSFNVSGVKSSDLWIFLATYEQELNTSHLPLSMTLF